MRSLDEIARDVYEFECRRGEWPDTKSVAERVSRIAEEVSEVFKAHRDGHDVNEIWVGPHGKPEGIPIELADVVLRTLATAFAWGIDIESAIDKKMSYNWSKR